MYLKEKTSKFALYYTKSIMENKEDSYKALKNAIERTENRKMISPRDFEQLSMSIFERTGEIISSMTLKRFWGYLGEANIRQPRLSTLNILASMIGYADWESYYNCNKNTKNNQQSNFLNSRALKTITLNHGTLIRLRWLPDRCIIIRHDGDEIFTVLESVNSKLSAGDTFRCEKIIDGEPLYVSDVTHNNQRYNNYVCGQIDGIKYNLIKDM